MVAIQVIRRVELCETFFFWRPPTHLLVVKFQLTFLFPEVLPASTLTLGQVPQLDSHYFIMILSIQPDPKLQGQAHTRIIFVGCIT